MGVCTCGFALSDARRWHLIPGAGEVQVTGGCEPPDVGVGDPPWIFGRAIWLLAAELSL